MANLLQTGFTWLADQMIGNAPTPVSYKRGATTISLDATVGESILRASDGRGGIRITKTDRDYLIRKTDLGVLFPPALGDTIIDDADQYEVLAPPGEPVFRTCDPFGVMIRVHCKQVV